MEMSYSCGWIFFQERFSPDLTGHCILNFPYVSEFEVFVRTETKWQVSEWLASDTHFCRMCIQWLANLLKNIRIDIFLCSFFRFSLDFSMVYHTSQTFQNLVSPKLICSINRVLPFPIPYEFKARIFPLVLLAFKLEIILWFCPIPARLISFGKQQSSYMFMKGYRSFTLLYLKRKWYVQYPIAHR